MHSKMLDRRQKVRNRGSRLGWGRLRESRPVHHGRGVHADVVNRP